MDPSEPPRGRPSPGKEIQGRRPIHLKARKEPNKIKRTPVAPLPPRPPPPPQHRPPVIIYTDSPKVIHTTPGDFMSLVQRLTSATPSSSTANAAASHPTSNVDTVGETASTIDEEGPKKNGEDVFDQVEIDGGAPNFFSPPMDPNSLNIWHEPSPAFDGNKNFMEDTSLASPDNFLTTPAEPSTGDYWDPFNHYQDFNQFDP